MQLGKRFTLFGKVILPLVLLWLLNIAPLPWRYTTGLREARQAQADGYHQLAAARLRQALAVQPQRSELWEQIGLEELAAGRDNAAHAALLAAKAADVLSVRGYLALGDLFARQGDVSSALATWQALLVKQGPTAAIYERQAQTYQAEGDEDALLAVLRAWHKLEPGNAQVRYTLGLHLSVRSPDEALPLLMEAARLDSSLDERVQVLRRGINQASGVENAGFGWVMIGRALARLEEWPLAQRAFEQATTASPGYAEAWAFLAEARYQTGANGEAALATAHSLNHRSTLVQAITAVYWRRQGRLEEALSYLQEVARQEPDEVTWQIELGNLQAEIGDLQAAMGHFQQATRLAPKAIGPWLALAHFTVAYHSEVRETGLPAARQALLLAPQDAQALDAMGLVFMALDDASSAERFLQRAIEQDATFADAYLHLGQLFIQQQDAALALNYLQKAQQLGQGTQTGEIAGRLLQRYFSEGGLR